MSDTFTRVVPQDGWSPIICHKVPIQQTITDIVGDKGANEIWLGGKIKNFHAKIDWQDQYSGSRVPADIITESSTDYGETWTMNEVEEHEEGSFELDYEGHERDFEVRINGTSLYIRYRWLMNGQEIEDADGSLEHTITVTDYPVRLEVKARYADNFGGHEIGANTFESATVFYKSGATASKTVGQLTKPTQTGANAVKWADKDGWQSQTWSYSENGRTVTAQVGANITALRDVKIGAELYIPDTWSNEDGKDYWYKTVGGSSSSTEVTFTRVGEFGGGVILKTNITNIPSNITPSTEDGFYEIYFDNKMIVYLSIVKGSILKTLGVSGIDDDEAFYSPTYEEYIEESGIEERNVEFFWDSDHTLPVTVGSANPLIIFREGATVSKSNLTVTMTRNDDSTYTTTDYWMPNNYALGRQKQSVTVQKGSLSTTLPVTVAYATKAEVGRLATIRKVDSLDNVIYAIEVSTPPEESLYDEGLYSTEFSRVYKGDYYDDYTPILDSDKYYLFSTVESALFVPDNYIASGGGVLEPVVLKGDFIKTYFYENAPYVEPIRYKAYYECYDGTEGFDEVAEINGEWESKVTAPNLIEYVGAYDWGGSPCHVYRFNKNGDDWENHLVRSENAQFTIYKGSSYRDWASGQDEFLSLIDDNQLYAELTYGEKEDVDSATEFIDLNSNAPIYADASLGEYGSEVGTLTLGSKKYLYRVGLEPIDEENYLFIKDFKDIPFNYGLVKCYEPQWEAKPISLGAMIFSEDTPTRTIEIEGGTYEVFAITAEDIYDIEHTVPGNGVVSMINPDDLDLAIGVMNLLGDGNYIVAVGYGEPILPDDAEDYYGTYYFVYSDSEGDYYLKDGEKVYLEREGDMEGEGGSNEDGDAWGYPLIDTVNFGMHYRVLVPDELKGKELMIKTSSPDNTKNVNTGEKLNEEVDYSLAEDDKYYVSFYYGTIFKKPSEWWFAYYDEGIDDVVDTDYKVEVPSDEPKITTETTTVTLDKSKTVKVTAPDGTEVSVMKAPFPYKQGYSAVMMGGMFYTKEAVDAMKTGNPNSAVFVTLISLMNPASELGFSPSDLVLYYIVEPEDGSTYHYVFVDMGAQKYGYFDDNGDFVEVVFS